MGNLNIDFVEMLGKPDFGKDTASFREFEKAFVAVREKIEAAIYTPIAPLAIEAYVTKEPVPYAERTTGRHITPAIGETWGELFDCAWFHFQGQVPPAGKGKKVSLLIDFSGEGLVFDQNGEPLKGLTSVTTTDEFPLGLWGKKTVEVSDCAAGGEPIDLWVDAGCNDLQGQYRNDGRVKEAAIVTVDTLARDLFYDFTVCLSLYVGLCENDDAYADEVLPSLLKASQLLEEVTPASMQAAREELGQVLSRENETVELQYSSIGHSHLDLIFLWPERETIRKGARTYSTALYLMGKYPFYKFGCSQPQIYVWMKEHYPSIYRRIKEREKEGRWECQGCFWVEMDTNLPSGESLVRQILYGKRFFMQEFGKEMKVGFLPDVFGYSAALPQLLVKSGTPYFMTQKLSMNDTNRFPRHTFLWKGIDGSEVLTHMLPEDSYNSAAVPQMAIYGLHHYTDLDRCDEALQLFGIGDGGGGPGYEHLERIQRQKNLKGVPPLRPEFCIDFFERINRKRDTYRKWVGELYFERHQGTYTSIAKGKWYNRQAEIKLHHAEWLYTLANLRLGTPYPHDRLEEIWKEILLYQFHDCLPGSAIKRAYEETHARYRVLLKELDGMIAKAEALLAGEMDVSGVAEPLAVFNPSSWERSEVIEVDGRQVAVTVPPLGCAVAELAGAPAPAAEEAPADRLENEKLRVLFNPDGTIASLYDKEEGREVLRENTVGNALRLYDDEYTHWDINKNYLTCTPEQARLVSAKGFARGVVKGIAMEYTIGQSKISQTVTLRDGSKRLDFETTVEWNETYKMLRSSFPVDIVTDSARCEIQYGSILRPTHQNTTWDQAKFEVCAHRYVDMADGGYGVAILNNGKYGYKVWDNVLDIDLLRSQMCPCEDGDKGVHSFTYAILPHAGGVVEGGVVRAGYELNMPLLTAKIPAREAGARQAALPAADTLARIDRPNIILDAVKRAEDTDGYILRFYEAGGRRTKAHISLNGLRAEGLADLLERPLGGEEAAKLAADGDGFTLDFHPFELHTVLVKRR
ncbi:MAG TPA: alpha-mannosidase [Firmicutes bacterium]|nr:alpha-mannosidase [Bacillota bacterium]